MATTERHGVPGDVGEWIEVADAKLPVGHVVWTIRAVRFNYSRSGLLRAHARYTCDSPETWGWIPLGNPPFWLESLMREVELNEPAPPM